MTDLEKTRAEEILSRIGVGTRIIACCVGAKTEFGESEKMGQFWPDQKVNLCGALTPRKSAATLGKTAVFIGHDGGPMHLAATVGIPCVAIFSARNKPGKWFPFGSGHPVIFHKTECNGCGLEACELEKQKYNFDSCGRGNVSAKQTAANLPEAFHCMLTTPHQLPDNVDAQKSLLTYQLDCSEQLQADKQTLDQENEQLTTENQRYKIQVHTLTEQLNPALARRNAASSE